MTVWFPKSREEEDLEVALELLRQIEYAGMDGEPSNGPLCLFCGAGSNEFHGKPPDPHDSGCRLAWLLARYPEAK